MATTYTWRVADLERNTADGIVTTVHYTIDAEDGTYRAGAYGSIGLAAPEEDAEIVPFADLTEELCCEWVCAALGEEQCQQVKDALQKQLDEQHAPAKANGRPW